MSKRKWNRKKRIYKFLWLKKARKSDPKRCLQLTLCSLLPIPKASTQPSATRNNSEITKGLFIVNLSSNHPMIAPKAKSRKTSFTKLGIHSTSFRNSPVVARPQSSKFMIISMIVPSLSRCQKRRS